MRLLWCGCGCTRAQVRDRKGCDYAVGPLIVCPLKQWRSSRLSLSCALSLSLSPICFFGDWRLSLVLESRPDLFLELLFICIPLSFLPEYFKGRRRNRFLVFFFFRRICASSPSYMLRRFVFIQCFVKNSFVVIERRVSSIGL